MITTDKSTHNFNMALSPDDVAVLWEAIAQYRENTAEAVEQYEDDAALARKLRVAEALEAQFDALVSSRTIRFK